MTREGSAESGPAASLLGIVARYRAWHSPVLSPAVTRVIPAAVVPMILNLGETEWRISSTESETHGRKHQSFVAGLHRTYGYLHTSGDYDCIQVEFTPLGAYRVFGLPLHYLEGTALSPKELLGHELEMLVEQLRGATHWGECFRLLDCFILRRVNANSRPCPQIEWVWRQVMSADKVPRVHELAGELGWSRKHLRERARTELGTTLKSLCRLQRFRRAEHYLRENEAPLTLAQVALLCGYSDQAHLTREVRQYSGWTPKKYQEHHKI